jgi:hypothetical protein
MARIRHAVSLYANERGSLIRVPFRTRRRRAREALQSPDRHRPEPFPKVCPCGDLSKGSAQDQRRRPAGSFGRTARTTIGDVIRGRYDQALRKAWANLNRTLRGDKATRRLLARFATERWAIPEPVAKTPLRQLARELNCSLGRVTRCETAFRDRIRSVLRQDPDFRRMLRLARAKRNGFDHRLTKEDGVSLTE